MVLTAEDLKMTTTDEEPTAIEYLPSGSYHSTHCKLGVINLSSLKGEVFCVSWRKKIPSSGRPIQGKVLDTETQCLLVLEGGLCGTAIQCAWTTSPKEANVRYFH